MVFLLIRLRNIEDRIRYKKSQKIVLFEKCIYKHQSDVIKTKKSVFIAIFEILDKKSAIINI